MTSEHFQTRLTLLDRTQVPATLATLAPTEGGSLPAVFRDGAPAEESSEHVDLVLGVRIRDLEKHEERV